MTLPVTFDGWPYIWTRITSALYHVILLPADATEKSMILTAKHQAERNDLPTSLVLGSGCAWAFDARGERSPVPPPRGGLLAYGRLVTRHPIQDSADLAARRLRLQARCAEQKGFIMGDETKGSRLATPEEAQRLSGVQASGVPAGLTKCPECGEWKGECLDPSPHFAGRVVCASCSCENRNLCARCGRPLDRRKLNANFLDELDGQVWHVPGFVAFSHKCEGLDVESKGEQR